MSSLTRVKGVAILCLSGAVGLAVIGFSSGGPNASRQPWIVSLVQLIATPERYDGKLVTAVGYLSYGSADGDTLYLGKEACENGVLENSLWLARTREMWRDRESLYNN